ncbi:hypothetical protein BVRB_1g014670 [Beta vulgaris subsp. vulgaris]|uniref:uncharacterized protein LOC104901710 isoform X1 n=1 Tax=Beta vulgaris subsp. vulgaris TaxID=3555 RepID=UPI00053FE900|nr:uncharacterized protein LOC104901710 isoform X1 [Beta vulgaris subsp. vulgaris]KMT19068.1 hypothetical protein BVRB_1g014670 [Beta vulgaris subsp. vulgaris]
MLVNSVPSSSKCCSCCTSSSSSFSLNKLSHSTPTTTLFSKRNLRCKTTTQITRFPLILAKSSDSSTPVTKQSPTSSSPLSDNNDTVFVSPDSVPLEGVIQFDKPSSSSRFKKWGQVALFAGGDVLAILLFAAIGRFSHGFPVFDAETLRTADPFIAGWFLSAYFLGGYGEDGRGVNGVNVAVSAAAKSWALGIPIGLGIRALTSAHFPPTNFILVTLGSTAVLLIGWRTLLFQILPRDKSKKDDMYKRGSPFELFELLTSLVRRW